MSLRIPDQDPNRWLGSPGLKASADEVSAPYETGGSCCPWRVLLSNNPRLWLEHAASFAPARESSSEQGRRGRPERVVDGQQKDEKVMRKRWKSITERPHHCVESLTVTTRHHQRLCAWIANYVVRTSHMYVEEPTGRTQRDSSYPIRIRRISNRSAS